MYVTGCITLWHVTNKIYYTLCEHVFQRIQMQCYRGYSEYHHGACFQLPDFLLVILFP